MQLKKKILLTGLEQHRKPNFITLSQNGSVVGSDYCGLLTITTAEVKIYPVTAKLFHKERQTNMLKIMHVREMHLKMGFLVNIY